MRILLVPASDWLSNPIPSRLHFIFERLAERHEVHVIRYPIPLWKVCRKSKAIVHEATGFPIRDLSSYYVVNTPNHLRLFDKILKTRSIDVIVFANILTGAESIILGKSRRIPLVCDYLDHFPESASSYYTHPIVKSLVHGIVLRITKWNLRNANHVVAVSDSFLKWLANNGIRNLSLIPNGVDLGRFKPGDRDNARQQTGIKQLEKKFVISYTGTVENWYDLRVVARATRILNSKGVPAIFQVVGGHLVNLDNDRYDGYKLNVIETGFVDNKQVPLYLNASDVCVLPLKNMAKNLTRPLKLLEYFSVGKPVFSLPNLELERAFGDAMTIFHDADELANLFLKIERNPDEFSSKVKKGYDYAQENSWDNHAKKYEKLLEFVVKNNV
jgi:phosphatidylinositol alpha-1,6-mannosyltransferase